MYRITLSAAVALGLFTAPALALSKAQECNLQAQIANAIVAERKSGSSQRRAERRVKSRLNADSQKYEVALPAMVEWIYTLPQGQLTDEVGATLQTSCMSQ